ncbi:hypothetical protein ACFW17_35470 [Streptomyces sp. NPDC058961]|uniref:hypothetical protein n=1 Tax=Streptomyces sp. NPDC058961 TaxID=3346680 RepID=UPI0036C64168
MLRKLEYDDGEPVDGEGFDEHAAAVTMTASVLTGAGFGTPLSWQTEIAHKLPYGYTQYADLTMRPGRRVPVAPGGRPRPRARGRPDGEAAPVQRWFELLAPKADSERVWAARGAAVHGFRLWLRIYPATGREGCPPVAFVFTGKTKPPRASRMRRLEKTARRYFAGAPYAVAQFTAVDYHQAVPVVVTELEQITADPEGAAGNRCGGGWAARSGRR